MLSRLRVGVRGCGEVDLVCVVEMGRGIVIVAMAVQLCSRTNAMPPPRYARNTCKGSFQKMLGNVGSRDVELVGR
jgi:hypothetical protein